MMASRFLRTLLLATGVALCASGSAAAQDPAPRGEPIVVDLEADQPFINTGPSPLWHFETSLDGVEGMPAILKNAKRARAGNWILWLLVGGGLGVSVLVGAFYWRWLYYDNVFGREYAFPESEPAIRLGGAFGGGHGAALRYRATAFAEALEREGRPQEAQD